MQGQVWTKVAHWSSILLAPELVTGH